MLEIKKQTNQHIAIIRTASGTELSEYEKNKLAGIEDNAQVNKIEVIKVNGKRLPIDTSKKEVRMELGDLAFKSEVTPGSVSANELFFIRCELDDTDLTGKK